MLHGDRPKRERRSQAERRADAEQRIIGAAIEILVEKGYDRLTLTDVGVRAGFSRTLPMHYFGSKNQLLAKAAEHIIAEIIARTEPKRQSSSPLDLIFKAVRSLAEGIACRDAETSALMVILGAGVVHEGLSDAIRDLDRVTIGWISSELQRGIDAGEVRSEISVDTEATLITACNRGLMNLFIQNSDIDILSQIDYFIEQTRSRIAR